MIKRLLGLSIALALVMIALPTAPQQATAQDAPTLVIYSGRNENLVSPLLEQFELDTRINVEVRYGDTADLAIQLLEEGENSPADVFFAQDAGALGLLADHGLLTELPSDVLDLVDPRFQSPDGLWVGVTGRARVVVYNTDSLTPEDLPDSIADFTDPQWSGRIGWAPTNASFQAFVTALRVTTSDEEAEAWLEGIIANEPLVYANNTAVVEAVATGEIEVGFVNHYYAYRKLAETPDAPIANYFFPAGDIGSMINVAGVAILNSSENSVLAQRFVLYLLSIRGQQYFVDNTYEYPLLVFSDFVLPEGLYPLDEYVQPDFDLSDLSDLETTLDMLESVGALE
ncbi:MAG: iron ABC transporter substrate-binding protein [Anaerolineales bacterium]|nr:iron ABC transporter substrate-binding protein [Anaerolineales bacterium]